MLPIDPTRFHRELARSRNRALTLAAYYAAVLAVLLVLIAGIKSVL